MDISQNTIKSFSVNYVPLNNSIPHRSLNSDSSQPFTRISKACPQIHATLMQLCSKTYILTPPPLLPLVIRYDSIAGYLFLQLEINSPALVAMFTSARPVDPYRSASLSTNMLIIASSARNLLTRCRLWLIIAIVMLTLSKMLNLLFFISAKRA